MVIPQVVGPHPAGFRGNEGRHQRQRGQAYIGEVFNTNALLAEALTTGWPTPAGPGRPGAHVQHHHLGGRHHLGHRRRRRSGRHGQRHRFLLSARLALPVMAASLDAKPTIEEAAAQLEGMGVTRIALAPCVIGPEADPAAIEEAASVIGAKCSAPLGAHGNVVKLFYWPTARCSTS